MIQVSASNITKSYGIDVILDGISFHVNKGDKIGLIGANGAGKTTLMNIISGNLSADSGDYFIAQNTKIGYIRQIDSFSNDNTIYHEVSLIFREVMEMEEKLSRMSSEIAALSADGKDVTDLLHDYDQKTEAFRQMNGYTYKSEINSVLSSLAFPKEKYDEKIGILSGGERTRLALACVLLGKPDVLLLDEPTNHLDIGSLKWLEQYLKSYSGTVVLISHDRFFLDQVTNRIFEIENHKISIYEGNYSTAMEKKQIQLENALRLYEKQQTELKRQEEIIRRFKQHGTEKLAKRAQSREKRLANIELKEKPLIFDQKIKVQFKDATKSGNDVLHVEDLSKAFLQDSRRNLLFENVSFDIKKGERVALIGPNGVGKTTLLKILLDYVTPDTGRFQFGYNVKPCYYDQKQELLETDSTVLEELHNSFRLYSEPEIRGMLGRFLFQGDDVFKPIVGLSGGEKARLSLLKLMLSGANFLIMDEPTNHLDIASKEVFEDALMHYTGTLLIVSHDRYLLNKVPTRILELQQSGVKTYLGAYAYYEEKKQSEIDARTYLREQSKSAPAEAQKEKSSAEERRQAKEAQMLKKRREKQLQSLEESIKQLEEEITSIELTLCEEAVFSDPTKSLELSEMLADKKAKLEQFYENWMDLE